MTDYVPAEKAMPIRYPSTANLLVDSDDRNHTNNPSPWDFQIARNNSLLNGFFTRVGTTEVVLEWCLPNISDTLGSNEFTIDISGVGGNTHNATSTVTLPNGFFTVEDTIDAIVGSLNATSGTTGATFTVINSVGRISIDVSGAVVRIDNGDTLLNSNLDALAPTFTNDFTFGCPDLRPYRYVDFVSSQLTYAQDLKDASTAQNVRDVLCRWYFAEDTEELADGYGFPILMGYKQFRRRRIFNPPKQIRWEPNLPIGQLSFQVYDPMGALLPYDPAYSSDWLMTLQVSEV